MTKYKIQPKNWRKVRLGEVAGVLGGFAFKSSLFNTKKIGYHVVKIQNIDNGFVDTKNSEYVSIDEIKRDISKFKIKKGDFLVAMTGATAGKVGLMVEDANPYLNQRVGKFFSKDLKKIDQKFLYYSIINPKNLSLLKKLADGSAQGNMSSSQIEEALEISFPEDIKEQKQIADVLYAFDNKIELNNKINQNLEQTAQVIFKELFLKNKKYSVKKIGEVAKVILGGTPSRLKKEYWGGDIPWINSGKVNEFRIISASENITSEGLKKSNTQLLPKRTTVIAITGATLGQVSLLEIEACANQSVVGIFGSKLLSQEFIYLFIKNKILEIIQEAAGGAQQHINKGIVENYPIIIPPKENMNELEKIVKPIFDKISENILENQKLASLRDLLLPKLMSGEIRV